MKKWIIRVISFFSKDHTPKYVVIISAFFVLFGVLVYLAAMDVVSNVFGTVVGFLLSSMMLYAFKIVIGRMEDMLKINYDTKALLKLYKGGKYEKKLKSGKVVAYAPVLVNTKENPTDYRDYQVVDAPEKCFVLDDFISGNYQTIFSAHSNSAKQNIDTIRLDRYDKANKTFYLSRSTYYNHLVTNRAIDFLLFDDVSLRTMFEYGPKLNTLENSKMSNHVGINALVFLSDENLLVPRRGNNSTISKNKITSSIATPLVFPEEFENDPKKAVIDPEYLLRKNIIRNLTDRLKLSPEIIEAEDKAGNVEITFLGFGKNIYEGGKPQFYFSVKLKSMDTDRYYALREEYLEELKEKEKAGEVEKDILDVDTNIYAARPKSYQYKKNYVEFEAELPDRDPRKNKNKTKKIKAGYEMSYLCNLWHYEQFHNPPEQSEQTDE